MADDKNAREDQAQREEERQQEREVEAALERGEESEPPREDVDIEAVDAELEKLSYPTTGPELVETVGDGPVSTPETTYRLTELLPETEVERFESPDVVRDRIARPTVAVAMKRIADEIGELSNSEFGTSQRDAYERTFRELQAIDAVDEDEGIAVVRDWIVDRIEAKGTIPGSRGVRRQAAKYCRSNGYSVRNDEWLGV